MARRDTMKEITWDHVKGYSKILERCKEDKLVKQLSPEKFHEYLFNSELIVRYEFRKWK